MGMVKLMTKKNNAPQRTPRDSGTRETFIIEFKATKKQLQAFDILQDNETTELLFGGASGPGKSYLGCVWLIYSCLRYPGSRWLMGRAVLKRLKESTLLTFFQVCNKWGLKAEKDFHYNSIEGIIKFFNSSAIYLKDLFQYPSDPEFDSLGSTEYTGAFIDEASEIGIKAKNILMSRLRFKLEEFDLVPKLLICSNPSKNFLYYEFYKPHKENRLPKFRKFLFASVYDNPFISPHHLENLKKLDEISKQRLLYGNFEYDDDPSRLMEYDSIIDIFTNTVKDSVERFLSVDIARFGEDKTTIFQWKGFFIEKIYVYSKQSTSDIAKEIERIAEKNHIPRSKIIIDEDGLGGGVVDQLPGVKGFVNNSRPIETRKDELTSNYTNLKSQCYFYLADHVNKGLIGCYKTIDPRIKDYLIEDLEQIKKKDIDKDGKIAVVPKEDIKEQLGRSTDYSDAMMMRMFFIIKKENKLFDLDLIEAAFK